MADTFRRVEEHNPHPQAQHRTACGCGQELDVCSHGYCPRCGHRVEAPQLASVS